MSSSPHPLLQCTMATRSPDGVDTKSIWGLVFSTVCPRTTVANTLVPADTLPVPGRIVPVATRPVPPSPSGGQKGIPGSSIPEGSRMRAPASVRQPDSAPATRTSGKNVVTSNPVLSLNNATRRASYVLVDTSTGNIPEASLTPNTLRPVSKKWMYPASVVWKAIRSTCSSPSRTDW